MQNVLNFLFEAIFITGSTYLSAGFVLGLIKLWHQSHPDIARQQLEKQPVALPAATAPTLDEQIQSANQRQLETVALENSQAE